MRVHTTEVKKRSTHFWVLWWRGDQMDGSFIIQHGLNIGQPQNSSDLDKPQGYGLVKRTQSHTMV